MAARSAQPVKAAGTCLITHMELHAGKLPKLLQGAMDNHAFLGALAAVACKQELLLDLVRG
jgi:hypothetical protein